MNGGCRWQGGLSEKIHVDGLLFILDKLFYSKEQDKQFNKERRGEQGMV
jgi:hypothetical protein